MQAVYELGLFQRFGLSNYQAADVEAVYDHCKEQGYVLPTVYQGSYSPITRLPEASLFPTLRRLGIAFYAYSPSAGGFLGKTVAQVEEAQKNPAPGPRRRYGENPAFLAALAKWGEVAEQAGVGRAELAYRWVSWHSPLKREHGDALIIGAGSLEQLEETLVGIEAGPLSNEAVQGVQEVWDLVKDQPPAGGFGPPRRP